MQKRKLLVLVACAGLLGGCAATLTPTGDVYTEALLPVDTTTVVVESYPLIAYGPRPHFRPAPPPRHRGHLRPGPHFAPVHRPHHRPHVRYGAPGQHRSPGQHRAPGVRGPRSPHHAGPFIRTGSRPQGAHQSRGPQGPSGRPQGGSHGQDHAHGPNRGPR